MQYLRRHSLIGIAVLLTAAILTAGFVLGGARMFSPGALSARSRPGITLGGVHSHAELAGNCAACHVAPWSSDTMANRCLNCHTDVREQIDGHHPLHGSFSEGMRCRTCHSEHKGPHALSTNLAGFDHDMAAFTLTGKQQAVDC